VDMLVACQNGAASPLRRNKSHMVLGDQSLPSAIYLESGFEGITVIAENDSDALGMDVALGDINADGLYDILLGAPGFGPPCPEKVYAIFGYNAINYGDPNYDKIIDLGDVVYLINYLYRPGPVPYPKLAGDANCNGEVELGDLVLLINYLYKGGPPPGCP